MRSLRLSSLASCLAVALAATPALGQERWTTPSYSLLRPAWSSELDADLVPQQALRSLGGLQLSWAASGAGSGLSLQAGQRWFARVGIGHSLESGLLSAGGGYRFADGESVSMLVTRQLGQDRLGLALRYDWPRTWFLRIGYDTRLGAPGVAEQLRFSAGLRF